MTYEEIKKSFLEAEELFIHAKSATQIAISRIAKNNLRNLYLPNTVLDDLKRELKNWDMNLHKWK
jgi:hypothetical protein